MYIPYTITATEFSLNDCHCHTSVYFYQFVVYIVVLNYVPCESQSTPISQEDCHIIDLIDIDVENNSNFLAK